MRPKTSMPPLPGGARAPTRRSVTPAGYPWPGAGRPGSLDPQGGRLVRGVELAEDLEHPRFGGREPHTEGLVGGNGLADAVALDAEAMGLVGGVPDDEGDLVPGVHADGCGSEAGLAVNHGGRDLAPVGALATAGGGRDRDHDRGGQGEQALSPGVVVPPPHARDPSRPCLPPSPGSPPPRWRARSSATTSVPPRLRPAGQRRDAR